MDKECSRDRHSSMIEHYVEDHMYSNWRHGPTSTWPALAARWSGVSWLLFSMLTFIPDSTMPLTRSGLPFSLARMCRCALPSTSVPAASASSASAAWRCKKAPAALLKPSAASCRHIDHQHMDPSGPHIALPYFRETKPWFGLFVNLKCRSLLSEI